jgi:hypothetical protein
MPLGAGCAQPCAFVAPHKLAIPCPVITFLARICRVDSEFRKTLKVTVPVIFLRV